jgi:hypothetical protein
VGKRVGDFSRVRRGMAQEEVCKIMGRADEVRPFILGGKSLTAWVYRFGRKWAVVLFDEHSRVKIRHAGTFGVW